MSCHWPAVEFSSNPRIVFKKINIALMKIYSVFHGNQYGVLKQLNHRKPVTTRPWSNTMKTKVIHGVLKDGNHGKIPRCFETYIYHKQYMKKHGLPQFAM